MMPLIVVLGVYKTLPQVEMLISLSDVAELHKVQVLYTIIILYEVCIYPIRCQKPH